MHPSIAPALRTYLIVLVSSNSVLEEDIGPLPGASDHRVVGVEGIVMEVLLHFFSWEDGGDVLMRNHL